MTMLELLRIAVAIPVGLAELAWDWLTRDEFEDFIADQRQRLNAMAEGL